jgi:hypothetical protein
MAGHRNGADEHVSLLPGGWSWSGAFVQARVSPSADSSELGNRMLGCRRVRAGCEMFRDQPGSLLGVDKPGRVAGWQLVKPAVSYLID